MCWWLCIHIFRTGIYSELHIWISICQRPSPSFICKYLKLTYLNQNSQSGGHDSFPTFPNYSKRSCTPHSMQLWKSKHTIFIDTALYFAAISILLLFHLKYPPFIFIHLHCHHPNPTTSISCLAHWIGLLTSFITFILSLFKSVIHVYFSKTTF